jgi:hypothetical protein
MLKKTNSQIVNSGIRYSPAAKSMKINENQLKIIKLTKYELTLKYVFEFKPPGSSLVHQARV